VRAVSLEAVAGEVTVMALTDVESVVRLEVPRVCCRVEVGVAGSSVHCVGAKKGERESPLDRAREGERVSAADARNVMIRLYLSTGVQTSDRRRV